MLAVVAGIDEALHDDCPFVILQIWSSQQVRL